MVKNKKLRGEGGSTDLNGTNCPFLERAKLCSISGDKNLKGESSRRGMTEPRAPGEYVAIPEQWKGKLRTRVSGPISHLESWEDVTLHYTPAQNVVITAE